MEGVASKVFRKRTWAFCSPFCVTGMDSWVRPQKCGTVAVLPGAHQCSDGHVLLDSMLPGPLPAFCKALRVQDKKTGDSSPLLQSQGQGSRVPGRNARAFSESLREAWERTQYILGVLKVQSLKGDLGSYQGCKGRQGWGLERLNTIQLDPYLMEKGKLVGL